MISPINFHWPNLPHFGVNLDIDPINLFISDNHVPMEIGTDVSKIVRKKKVFKMCFRSQIMQKRTWQIIFFFSIFYGKNFVGANLDMRQIWTWTSSTFSVSTMFPWRLLQMKNSSHAGCPKIPHWDYKGVGGKTGQRQIWTRWGKYFTRKISGKIVRNSAINYG